MSAFCMLCYAMLYNNIVAAIVVIARRQPPRDILEINHCIGDCNGIFCMDLGFFCDEKTSAPILHRHFHHFISFDLIISDIVGAAHIHTQLVTHNRCCTVIADLNLQSRRI